MQMTILVVDDQLPVLCLLQCQLSRAGYCVVACRSGEEAVEQLQSQAVDMIITDMEMGAMTGEDVLRHVRKEFGSLPVVLMSGNPGNLRADGFDGYLEKPFSMPELLAVVERLTK